MEDWQDTVAESIREEILNGHDNDRWPQTADEWRSIAERFGYAVVFHPDMKSADAFIYDNILHVPLPPVEESPTHQRVYAHEIAEAATTWEGRAPINVPTRDMRQARHDVARRVERKE